MESKGTAKRAAAVKALRCVCGEQAAGTVVDGRAHTTGSCFKAPAGFADMLQAAADGSAAAQAVEMGNETAAYIFARVAAHRALRLVA